MAEKNEISWLLYTFWKPNSNPPPPFPPSLISKSEGEHTSVARVKALFQQQPHFDKAVDGFSSIVDLRNKLMTVWILNMLVMSVPIKI